MTTIIGTTEMIVADSRVSNEKPEGDDTHYSAAKIFRKGDAIIAGCSTNVAIEEFIKWYGSRKKRPKLHDKDFEALVLTKQGLFVYDEDCARDKVLQPWFSIGSGAAAALGALHAGADPVRALEIACLVDKHTAPPIQIMRLTDEPVA